MLGMSFMTRETYESQIKIILGVYFSNKLDEVKEQKGAGTAEWDIGHRT